MFPERRTSEPNSPIERAKASATPEMIAGARPLTVFRRIVLPSLSPAIISGVALAFARSIGEFGSLVLLSGNIPYKTEVASVFIFGQVESGTTASAAAVSVLLLAVALV